MQKIKPSNKKDKKNIHAGSGFDNFLKEDGIFEHCQEVGVKYAFLMQLQDEIEKQNSQTLSQTFSAAPFE